jgi:hypothetical protein
VFAVGSRYGGLPQATYVDQDDRAHRYVLLREIPTPPDDRLHQVQQGDRLDVLASNYFGDPEQSWRICDANRAFDPDELVAKPSRRLLIPLQVR